MTEQDKVEESFRKLNEALDETIKYWEEWKKFRDWVITKYHKDILKKYEKWSDYWFLLEAIRVRGVLPELENRLWKDLALFYLLAENDPAVYERLSPWNWTIRELLFFFMIWYKLRFEEDI